MKFLIKHHEENVDLVDTLHEAVKITKQYNQEQGNKLPKEEAVIVYITDMEIQYLSALATSEFCEYLGDQVWTNCIWHELGKSARGVASSLVKKGLINTEAGSLGQDSCTNLTESGIELVIALNIEGCKLER